MDLERESLNGKKQKSKTAPVSIDDQWLAIEALRFFGSDPDQAQRFFAWSGRDASSIRSSAGEPGFTLGVLDYFAQNLVRLERFCEVAGFAPGDVIRLHESLKVRGLTSHDDI